MDAESLIRAKLPGFPGYEGETERARSDEYVRAYIGEALTDLRERLHIASSPRLDALLFRAEFVNQNAFKPFENAYLDEVHIKTISERDMQMLRLADRVASVDAAGLDAYLDEVERAFNARDRSMAADS